MTYDNTVPSGVVTFMEKVTEQLINPIIGLIFAAALAYFLYGLMMFILNAGDQGKRTEGKSHMFWGVVGMSVMVAVGGIIAMALNTFGVDTDELPKDLPLQL